MIPATAPGPGVELSLVLPTFKEARNIRTSLERVAATLRQVPDLQFEIIVVDDDSPDQTWRIAGETAAKIPEVRVMRRVGENGLATAVIRGWQVAHGQIIGVMDADLQHPPEVLIQLMQAIRQSTDIAIGSRHVEQGGVGDWSLIRRIISRGAQVIGLILLPEVVSRVTDPMSGYFLLRRQTIGGCPLNPTGYKILIEVLARGQMQKISEVGYIFQERTAGESKVSSKIYIQYFEHLLRLRLDLLTNSRLLRFAIVGLSGAVVDMGLLYLFSDPASFSWGLTRSKIAAAEIALINNFLWNDAWTFADLASNQPAWRYKFRRFVKFNIICLAGIAINVVLLNIQFNWLDINRYLANFVAIVVATGWNYTINKSLGWRATNV